MERPPARGGRWGERPPPGGMVVEVAGLVFRVVGLPMADGSRGKVSSSDGGSTMMVVWSAAEVRRRESLAGVEGRRKKMTGRRRWA